MSKEPKNAQKHWLARLTLNAYNYLPYIITTQLSKKLDKRKKIDLEMKENYKLIK